MKVAISMLRGVNVGGHNCIRMASLRKIYESLGLRDVQTYVQSGNVVFSTKARDLAPLAKRIESKIEQSCGFRPNVILRTPSQLRKAIGRNPFATRQGIDPGKLVITFLAADPAPPSRVKLLAMNAGPEELHIEGSDVYVYYPNGMGRAKLSSALIEKTLETAGTGRNWNTVTKLLEMADKLESACPRAR